MISSGRKYEIRRQLKINWKLISGISLNTPNNKIHGALMYTVNEIFFQDIPYIDRDEIAKYKLSKIIEILDSKLNDNHYAALEIILSNDNVFVVPSPVFTYYYLEDIKKTDPVYPYQLRSKTTSCDVYMYDNLTTFDVMHVNWEKENGIIDKNFDYDLFFNDTGIKNEEKSNTYFLYKVTETIDNGVKKYIIRGKHCDDNLLQIAP